MPIITVCRTPNEKGETTQKSFVYITRSEGITEMTIEPDNHGRFKIILGIIHDATRSWDKKIFDLSAEDVVDVVSQWRAAELCDRTK